MKFTIRFLIALAVTLAISVILAPLAAIVVAHAGFHIPFPRIFDRVVMLTMLAVLLASARWLRFGSLISRGFRTTDDYVRHSFMGLVSGLIAMTVLFACAIALGSRGSFDLAHRLSRLPGFIVSALAIAIIEEAFFRAWLMAGMIEDFGRPPALALSSLIYAVSHVIRAPAHFYVTSFRPTAGLHDLAASANRLVHPMVAAPEIIGLFLLGVLLGEAFLVTGTVYLAIGLHAGVVIGAKLWPAIMTPGVRLPRWLIGQPHLGLISGPAAWLVTIALITLLPVITRSHTK
jgi:membrane protease YdiL (CAAX protease family)